MSKSYCNELALNYCVLSYVMQWTVFILVDVPAKIFLGDIVLFCISHQQNVTLLFVFGATSPSGPVPPHSRGF